MNDSSRTSSSRRRRSRKAGLLLGVVGLGLIGFGAWKVFVPAEEESPYRFGKVMMGDIEDVVTATGTLEPREYVDVGAQVSGQIEEIFVEIGDVVKAGDLLAKIDAEQSRARVESNEASLESSRTNLRNQINNLEKAERDFRRQENLRAENATTEEQYLNAKTTYENAKNSVRSSELSIKQQEANMRIEKKNLGFTEIRAPIDGTVMSIAVKVGQAVNASQSVPVVLRLANLSTMTVRADVSEADVTKLYEGMPVYFNTLGAGQNRRWYATLKRIEPSPKNQQGVILYPALFDVENEVDVSGRPALRPQMTTQVFFVAAEARNVLMVPMAALQQGQQIARELAAKERERDGNAERRPGGPPGGAGPAMAANMTPPATAGSASATEPPPAGAAGTGATPEAGGPPGGRGNGGPGGPGGFGGQRGGGGPGGFGGQRGGGGFAQMSPEERARFREGGGGPGGFGGGGGFRGMGAGGGAGPGATQQRRGTVMVKKPDGTLEPRQVVVGVSDRVHGQVIEGLTEGEEVIVGKAETEPQTGPTAGNNNNNNFRGQGGFPGGGGNFGGGNRPFR